MDSEAEERLRDTMIAAQAGDSMAYEKLLRDIIPAVRRLAALCLADPSGEEDVVQNVLLSFHRARHTYRPERPFGPWLRAVIRNAARDAIRTRRRRARYESTWSQEALERAAAPPASATEGPLSATLATALAALPPSQREALQLLHLEDLTGAEAARLAGVSEGALRLRAHRALRSLRAWIPRNPS